MRLVILLIILDFGLAHAQVKGIIVDNTSQESLSHAHIIFPTLNSGVVSDENGYFFSNKVNIGDTIVVTYLGYKSKTIIVNEKLITDNVIGLEKSSIDMEKVTVKPFESQYQSLGDKQKKPNNKLWFDNSLDGYEIVRYIETDCVQCYLKSMSLFFFDYPSDFEIRLSIYDVNEKGLPGKYLGDKIMVKRVTESGQWVKFGLEEENIIVSKRFFVGLEFLKKYNKLGVGLTKKHNNELRLLTFSKQVGGKWAKTTPLFYSEKEIYNLMYKVELN